MMHELASPLLCLRASWQPTHNKPIMSDLLFASSASFSLDEAQKSRVLPRRHDNQQHKSTIGSLPIARTWRVRSTVGRLSALSLSLPSRF